MVSDDALVTCMLCHEPCISACPITVASGHQTYAPSRLAQAAWAARQGVVPWAGIADTLYYCIDCKQCTDACVYTEEPMNPGAMLLDLRHEMQTVVDHSVAIQAEANVVPPSALPQGQPGDYLIVADLGAPGAAASVQAAICVLAPHPAWGYLIDLGWHLGISGGEVSGHLERVVEQLNQWPGPVLAAFPRDVVWLNQIIGQQWGVRLMEPVKYFALQMPSIPESPVPNGSKRRRAYHPSRYVVRDLRAATQLATVIGVHDLESWWKPGSASLGPALGIDRWTRQAMVRATWGEFGTTEYQAVITDDPYIAEALRDMAKDGQQVWLVPDWIATYHQGGTNDA